MKGQRFGQPLTQTGHGGGVQQAQLRAKPRQCRLGLGVGGLILGPLELLPEGGMLVHRQVAHHVFTLVPLAPLRSSLVAENPVHRLAQSLGPVDHTQQPRLDLQPAIHQSAQEGRASPPERRWSAAPPRTPLQAPSGQPSAHPCHSLQSVRHFSMTRLHNLMDIENHRHSWNRPSRVSSNRPPAKRVALGRPPQGVVGAASSRSE